MSPNPPSTVNISIIECRGKGISINAVLDGFKKMKSELEALGCEVSITVWGWPIDAIEIVEAPESEGAQ